jgi:hypothetical protein
MAKIDLKGFVSAVGQIQTIGANNTKKQEVVLHVPAYRDQFDEVKGKDEHWLIELIGEEIINKYNLNQTNVKMKCKATVFINSRMFTPEGGKTFYPVNCVLKEFDFNF